MGFSFWHLFVVVLVIVLLLGGGRVSSIMEDFARGITAFRRGMREDAKDTDESEK